MKQLNLNIISPVILNAELVAKSILDRANEQAEMIIISAKHKYSEMIEARNKISSQINRKTWTLKEREQEIHKLCEQHKKKQAEIEEINNFKIPADIKRQQEEVAQLLIDATELDQKARRRLKTAEMKKTQAEALFKEAKQLKTKLETERKKSL